MESPSITIVTGIWDLGRSLLDDGWSRSFDHYKEKFEELLSSIPSYINMIIFIEQNNESIVWKYRDKTNTSVYFYDKSQFNSDFFPFFDKIQKIRTDPNWINQVGWLKDSTQAKMEYYNPMVMSKMFMLHNAKCFNPYNSDYMFWIDGGITNTVHPGYFSHDKVLDKLPAVVNKFLFVCFPYETETEIHGFNYESIKKYAQCDIVNRVARGGFFGGHINYISEANNLYYHLLNDTLNDNLMGTEESIFTIMNFLYPDKYEHSMIQADGLISTFFENLKNNHINNIICTNQTSINFHNNNKIILYINTFNFPNQLQMVLDSFNKYDRNFIDKTTKILINNSIDNSSKKQYNEICAKYDFAEHIQKGNMGICGARQFAAEHFADTGSKYMLFFEDDMLLDFENKCSFGFNKQVNNLFNSIIHIMNIEEYDFLKLSFSEFYGHNGEQWSWHNVPSELRLKYFPNNRSKPNTRFSCIKSLDGVVYADGEIYYSNWPHIISQRGNKTIFLDTKWNHPYEQTWMSHVYTLTIENRIKPAILLSSPITHNRIHFYEAKERKES